MKTLRIFFLWIAGIFIPASNAHSQKSPSLNPIMSVDKINVTNVLGQIMLEEKINGRTIIQMDAGRLASGSYFVTLIGDKGAIIETKKLFVVK